MTPPHPSALKTSTTTAACCRRGGGGDQNLTTLEVGGETESGFQWGMGQDHSKPGA